MAAAAPLFDDLPTLTAFNLAHRVRCGWLVGRAKPTPWLRAFALALALFAPVMGGRALPASAAPLPRPLAQISGPGFEPSVCPFAPGAIPANERVECGFLAVPEDRETGLGGAIRLAVAILRSHSSAPAPDPVLFLEDGPGYAGLDRIGYFLTPPAAALRADRDIILLDQRGAGHSQPNLRCWEFDELERAARAQRVPADRALALDFQTAAACHDRLANGGVNLAAYTTAAAAADVDDLRAALGVIQWNLYGLGYGSRLALTILRDYPDGVRSVILDAAQPPQAQVWDQAAANLNRAFGALFNGCAAQPACGSAFPDLAAGFAQAAGRYDVEPPTIQTPDPITAQLGPQIVAGDSLVALIAHGLADTAELPYLPLAVKQIEAASPRAVENLFTSLAARPDVRHSGLWYSVQCHDEAPFANAGLVQADAQAYPRLRGYVQRDTTLTVCPLWGAGQAGPLENQPVRSDIPALVLAGAYDPLQPPEWGQAAASTLRGSFYYELPAASHEAGLAGCGQHLVLQFIQSPSVPPESGCVGSQPAPDFVTAAYLNPGIYPVAGWLLVKPNLEQWLPFLACAALFLSGLLIWPVAAVRQRREPGPSGAGFARWLASMAGLLDGLFAAALVWLMLQTYQAQPRLLVFGLPPEAAPLFVAPWAALVLAVALLAVALLAWQGRYWSIWGRLHFTLVAVAGAGFVWLLYRWGLIGL